MSKALSRRHLLKNLSLAGLAMGTLPAAKAASGSKIKTMPLGSGYYRKQIGDIELSVITDGTLALSSAVMGAGYATPEQVAEVLEETRQPLDSIPTHIHCSVIKAGDKVILVDTGIAGAWGPDAGFLPKNLANAGFKPSDITDVVLTHAHPDHILGALDSDGNLVFPNAAHHITQAELDQWNGLYSKIDTIENEGFAGMVRTIHQVLEGLKKNLNVIADGEEIAPGVSTMALPGHTNGHFGLQLESQGKKHWFLADIAHNHELFFAHPEWSIDYDTNSEQAIATRKKVFAQVAKEGIEVSGSHFPFPAIGHIAKSGTGYRWLPEVWQWS